VKVLLSFESKGLSDGVASRMLFNIICVKTESNCLAAAFKPCCGLALAWARMASKPCTSSAKRFDNEPRPLLVSVVFIDASALLVVPVPFAFMTCRL
jgi:hypothetical protein